jgi:flagellin
MSTVINTNVLSMTAQRNLNRATGEMQTAVQRLSSGLRINSARDDAAGIAVATRMTSQIGGLSVAIRNANDGVSVAQVAEGAMDEMVRNLNRARDLAVQAASYNNTTDRNSLNQEVHQMIDEIARVANQTRYNGDRILQGSFSADFQIGAFVNETLNVSLTSMSPTEMGVATNYSSVSAQSAANLAGQIARQYNTALGASGSLDGASLGTAVAANSNSINKISVINAKSSDTGITAFAYGNGLVGATFATNGATATVTDGISAGALTINGVSIGAVAGGADNSAVATNLATVINSLTSAHGVTASVVTDLDGTGAGTGGRLVLTNTSGSAISVIANTTTDSGIAAFLANGSTAVGAGQNGAIVLNDTLGDTSVAIDGSATALALTGASASTATLSDKTLTGQTVTSPAGANLLMIVVEKSLDTINANRASIGARLNRFEAVIRNLENVRENVSAARSRIEDADFAEETTRMTRAQILTQAGTAMVAQANQAPQGVMQLLQG